ncbi:glycosyltransferase [bacterium]|nr:glycosyltransferase [bacterium]
MKERVDQDQDIKVLYLITGLDFGGTEASVMRLAAGIRQRGYDVCVCSIKRPGYIAGELSRIGIRVESLFLPSNKCLTYPVFFIPAYIKWRKLLMKERPDILHSFLFQANMLAGITKRFQRGQGKAKAFISSVRCIEIEKPGWKIILDRWALNKSDLTLAVSHAVMRRYLDREHLRGGKVRVVYHGVESIFAEKQIDTSRERLKLGFCKEENIIGTVARLHRDKGVETLLEGAALAIKSQPGVRLKLLIIGDGPEKGRLSNMAKRLGIMDRVIFAGFQPDIIPWISSLDIFCLTSREEGMPQSLLEAMALGKPLIATNVGGVDEVVKDQISGLLVHPEDPEAVCRGILFLIKNPEKALDMGKNGRDAIKRGFLINNTLDQIESIYQYCLYCDHKLDSNLMFDKKFQCPKT